MSHLAHISGFPFFPNIFVGVSPMKMEISAKNEDEIVIKILDSYEINFDSIWLDLDS
jgi:hypothetical protein